ncbi:MAG: thioredoxin family protein [candidate division Zixibacteria bacterium]|nr:thioredoxin family protein [candidate division Zixibacteria bacterium]
MNRWPRILGSALILAALALPAVAQDKAESKKADSAKADSIVWLSFPDGLVKAKQESKHVLVDFTASWCSWCKKMDKETFKDSAVVARINEKFVPVKVWGDSDDMLEIEGYKISQKQLAVSEFNVRGYPAFWFISPEGQRIGPLPGYQPAERFIQALDYVSTRQYEVDAKKQGDGK